MNKEMSIEEVKEQLNNWVKYMKNNKEKVNQVDLIISCIETVLNELENSVNKDNLKEIIEKEPSNDPYVIQHRLNELLKGENK